MIVITPCILIKEANEAIIVFYNKEPFILARNQDVTFFIILEKIAH